MGSTDYAGSWFSTGFFGHERGRRRNDFQNYYRQLARPQPPELFLKRLQEYRTKNVNPFSEHDTKQSREFINVSFEQPVSAKVRASKSARFVSRDVIAWTHRNNENKSAVAVASAGTGTGAGAGEPDLTSSYSATYNPVQPKQITSHPLSYYESKPWMSSYRNAFCKNQSVLDVNGHAQLVKPYTSRTVARSASMNDLHLTAASTSRQQAPESVSSCLVWCDANSRSQLNREQIKGNSLERNPQNEAT